MSAMNDTIGYEYWSWRVLISPRSMLQCILSGFLMHFIVVISLSQGGFNHVLDEGVSLRFISIASSEDVIYISGFYRLSQSSYQQGFVAALDSTGGIDWWHEIGGDTVSITMEKESGIGVLPNRSIAVPFMYVGRNSFGVTVIDSGGNIENTTIYEHAQYLSMIPKDIVLIPDGFVVTGIVQFPDFDVDAFVLRTDKSGNLIWMKTFGHPVYWENSRTVYVVNQDTYVVSGTRYSWEQEPIFYHGWVCAIDSLGNKKWEWEANEDEVPHRGIMSIQYDKDLIQWICLSFIQKPVFVPDLGREVDLSVPVVAHRDSNMQLLTYQEYGPYSYNGYMGVLEKSLLGGWIAAGNITCLTEEVPYNDCNIESGRVLRIGANDSLEWSVIDTAFFHPELGSRSYLSGVTESPSGSVYAVGWANNYDDQGVYRSFGWLLKITADGCVDTLCTTTSLLEEIRHREQMVMIYPNPASGYLIAELHEQVQKDAYLELVDISGRLVLRERLTKGQHQIHLDNTMPGMYIWRLIDEEMRLLSSGKLVIE